MIMILSFLSKVKREQYIPPIKSDLYIFMIGEVILTEGIFHLKEDYGVRSSYHLYEIVVTGKVDVLRRKENELHFQNIPVNWISIILYVTMMSLSR